MSDSPTLLMHQGQRQVFESPARFRVLVTGRRWGKTELDKAESAKEFGAPGLVWYIAPTYDMARDLMWRPMRSWVSPSWLAAEPNETRMELETIWGCRFACKSAEHPDRLRGRGVRKVICDEWQDWKDGLQVLEEVLMPTLLTTDGSLLITGTPKSFNHLHKAYTRGGDPKYPDWASWQFRTIDAPHIQRKAHELERMRAQMDPRAFRQEYEASFESIAGRAYYAFERRHNVVPITLDPHHPACIGFDFNSHPATAVIWQRVRDEARVWREVWIEHAGGEATRASATRARELLAEAGWRGPTRIYGDPAGVSANTTGPSDHAVVREVFRHAEWMIPRQAPHVRDKMEAVNTRCLTADGRRHLFVDPSCEHLMNDLEQVTVPMLTSTAEKRRYPDLTHISDAMAYGIHQEWPPVARGGVAMGYAAWL